MQTLILDAAGCEFVKRVLKLCGTSRYSVRGKFVDILLESAVEAGRLTAEVKECASAEERRAAALKALDALKKTTFCLKVAEDAEYFPPRRIKSVFELAEEIKNSLTYYAYGKKIVSSGAEKPKTFDADGFNDDYIG